MEILLNDILQQILVKNNVQNHLDWHVHVTDDHNINAMALPGGNILFLIGICDVFDNVDQIAMVMAHEVSHVLLRHSVRQASKKFLNIIAMAFACFSFEFGVAYVYAMEKMESVYKLKHSRVHEARADEKGLELLQRAGFNIHEGPKMILKFHEYSVADKITGYKELDQSERE